MTSLSRSRTSHSWVLRAAAIRVAISLGSGTSVSNVTAVSST
jgi:hypothetical protein